MNIVNKNLNLENNDRTGLPVRMTAPLLLAMFTRPIAFKEHAMKKIPLTQGKFALVDHADYEWLMQWKWFLFRSYRSLYARTNICIDGKWKSVNMHTLLMKQPNGAEIDHRDCNGLNNQRSNIRVCTPSQNCQNRRPSRKGSSRYKGVTWNKWHSKWMASISVPGKRKHLGYFTDEMEAAHAYDRSAKELFGDFARPNFP